MSQKIPNPLSAPRNSENRAGGRKRLKRVRLCYYLARTIELGGRPAGFVGATTGG